MRVGQLGVGSSDLSSGESRGEHTRNSQMPLEVGIHGGGPSPEMVNWRKVGSFLGEVRMP